MTAGVLFRSVPPDANSFAGLSPSPNAMNLQDLFVGGLAIALGVVTLTLAAIGSHAPYALPKLRWLEAQIGRAAARATLAALGLGLIALGAAIAAGWSFRLL